MHKKQHLNVVLSIILTLSLTVFACGGGNGGKVELKSDNDKVSYTIGIQIGQSIQQQGIDVNPEIVGSAINDVLTGNTPLLTNEEMTAAMQNLQNEMLAMQQQQAADNLAAANAFFAENARKTGITTLPDSLQYEVITEGTGLRPAPTDVVKVHYHGTLIDGTVFDSSVERGEPAQFMVNGVIPGWTEVLQLMKTGAKWKVYIPPQLAYGERGTRGIQPNSLLIFEIELLEIMDTQE
jgi:FKBP-type peptidyl-prolyl cis-trans isomerase